MADNVEYSPEARKELHQAACYYQSIGKEEAFLDGFFVQVDRISEMPTAFQVRYRDVRIATLDDFRYAIHYIIYKEVVYILHIFGQNQNY